MENGVIMEQLGWQISPLFLFDFFFFFLQSDLIININITLCWYIMVQLHEECVAGKIYINNKKVHCSISVTSDRTRLIIEKTNTAADEDLICK